MRTACVLTVSPSMHCTGRVSAPGGCLLPRGACSRGCVPALGRGLPAGGGIPACTEADPPLCTEFLTHATENITLPQISFAGANYMPKAVNYLSLIQQQHIFRLQVSVSEQKPIMGRKLQYNLAGME